MGIINTKLEVGNRLLCKKSANWWSIDYETFEFVKGNFYQIKGVHKDCYIEFEELNFSIGGLIHIVKLWEIFCTPKEIRNLKLNQISTGVDFLETHYPILSERYK